jgi:hypothetical protein
MIYELRSYTAMPGKLPALLSRFTAVTTRFWAKHGIRQLGSWTVEIGNSNRRLYYILAWESLAEREARWEAFTADPEWIAERSAGDQNGPLIDTIENTFLKPTGFSPLT